jgi:6-pyruvoyltetrahydropterin/6-carboxytetrahydropterin synthase
MIETFREFTFEAAHQTPPYSGLHGHSFLVRIYMRGEPDPRFGWSHNQYDVEPVVEMVRREIDQRYLNDVPGLAVPTLENVTLWLWNRFAQKIAGLHRVTVQRGQPGQVEGCTYEPPGVLEAPLRAAVREVVA